MYVSCSRSFSPIIVRVIGPLVSHFLCASAPVSSKSHDKYSPASLCFWLCKYLTMPSVTSLWWRAKHCTLNGRGFSSYLATAAEQVCKANMAPGEIWWARAAHASQFNVWFIKVKRDGGMAAEGKERWEPRREERKWVSGLIWRPMLTLWWFGKVPSSPATIWQLHNVSIFILYTVCHAADKGVSEGDYSTERPWTLESMRRAHCTTMHCNRSNKYVTMKGHSTDLTKLVLV